MKVVGLGNPIMDEIAFVDEDFIQNINAAKGGMELIDLDALKNLKSNLKDKTHKVAGGSSANTIFALTKLGIETSFIGKLGECILGEDYKNQYLHLGGDISSLKFEPMNTGNCISLVTPDSERTMRTYLGAATKLSIDDISIDDFKSYDLLHIEGYMLYNIEVLKKSLKIAKSLNMLISLDLASFEIVKLLREEIKEILIEYIDIVFANEDEATTFANLGKSETEKSLDYLSQFCEISVVKLGKKGSILKKKDLIVRNKSIETKNCIDTTGAGDFWASGFLYGISKGLHMKDCSYIGTLLASSVIQEYGGQISEKTWNKILAELNKYE